MQVLLARATKLCSSSITSHSTRPIVRPPLITLPTPRSLAFHTGFMKLIFISRVVKFSPSSRCWRRPSPWPCQRRRRGRRRECPLGVGVALSRLKLDNGLAGLDRGEGEAEQRGAGRQRDLATQYRRDEIEHLRHAAFPFSLLTPGVRSLWPRSAGRTIQPQLDPTHRGIGHDAARAEHVGPPGHDRCLRISLPSVDDPGEPEGEPGTAGIGPGDVAQDIALDR